MRFFKSIIYFETWTPVLKELFFILYHLTIQTKWFPSSLWGRELGGSTVGVVFLPHRERTRKLPKV